MRAATNLIQRAAALMAEDDPNWGKLNFELSSALWSTGDRARADEVLESVLATALASNDAGLEWHARLERAGRRGLSHDDDLDQYLSVAERAREVFESAGDSLGLARAWRRIGLVHRLRGQFGLAVDAEELALEHAVRIGDGREEGRIVDSLCSALLYGPVPAAAAIQRCDALADGARGRPSVEAAVLSSLAGLVAMEGRFDEARGIYEEAKTLWEELGLRYAIAGLTQVGGEIELLASDPLAAERELRYGAEILEPLGGAPMQSALLARALAEQGADGADDLARAAVAAAGGHELRAEVIGLATRATIAAQEGRHDDALELAKAATARSEDADAPNLRADALVALAQCHALAGRSDQAAACVAEARSGYASKGNRAAVERIDRDGVPSLPSR
jgi:tetratricopeptide (TPR) repeat protein